MFNFFWSEPALNSVSANPTQSRGSAGQLSRCLALRGRKLKKIFVFLDEWAQNGIRADMAGALVKGTDVSGGTKSFLEEIRKLLKKNIRRPHVPNGLTERCARCHSMPTSPLVRRATTILCKESWRILNESSEGHSFFD